MFTYYATSGRGTSVNFGDVCTSKSLKTWTYLRMKQMKIGTPFKAHTLAITLCSREKITNSMNVLTLFRFCNIGMLRIVQCYPFSWSFTHCNFIWYNLYCLSKDPTGNTMQTGAKMIPFVRIKNLKNGQPYPVTHTRIAHIKKPLPF